MFVLITVMFVISLPLGDVTTARFVFKTDFRITLFSLFLQITRTSSIRTCQAYKHISIYNTGKVYAY